MAREFTFADLRDQSVEKSLYVAIHEKVYDVGSFIDAHPGGQNVLEEVRGQDATEPFEDTGHSEEAHEILETLAVGVLKRLPGDPEAKVVYNKLVRPDTSVESSSLPSRPRAVRFAIGTILVITSYMGYSYLQARC